jgi:hypothetical protein
MCLHIWGCKGMASGALLQTNVLVFGVALDRGSPLKMLEESSGKKSQRG